MSLAQQIRDRWLAGETINATDMAKQLKCSSSVVTMVKKNMTDEGYVFEGTERRLPRKGGSGSKIYMDYKLVSGPNMNGASVENSNGNPALPTLGATVTITLLAIDEHGIIRVGFREGKRTWLCEVRSTTP